MNYIHKKVGGVSAHQLLQARAHKKLVKHPFKVGQYYSIISRTDQFLSEHQIPSHVHNETLPFLFTFVLLTFYKYLLFLLGIYQSLAVHVFFLLFCGFILVHFCLFFFKCLNDNFSRRMLTAPRLIPRTSICRYYNVFVGPMM